MTFGDHTPFTVEFVQADVSEEEASERLHRAYDLILSAGKEDRNS